MKTKMQTPLPPLCYSVLPSTGEAIILEYGVTGYTPAVTGSYLVDLDQNQRRDIIREFVNERNNAMGVTATQEAAMLFGSMFGFHTPGANPDNYDENGEIRRVGEKHNG